MKILVINCGSSSLKFQLIDSDSEQVICKGLCERIGIDGSQISYTPAGKDKIFDDSYIRKNAIKHRVPYITTMAAAKASAAGIKAIKEQGQIGVKSLQEIHNGISYN